MVKKVNSKLVLAVLAVLVTFGGLGYVVYANYLGSTGSNAARGDLTFKCASGFVESKNKVITCNCSDNKGKEKGYKGQEKECVPQSTVSCKAFDDELTRANETLVTKKARLVVVNGLIASKTGSERAKLVSEKNTLERTIKLIEKAIPEIKADITTCKAPVKPCVSKDDKVVAFENRIKQINTQITDFTAKRTAAVESKKGDWTRKITALQTELKKVQAISLPAARTDSNKCLDSLKKTIDNCSTICSQKGLKQAGDR